MKDLKNTKGLEIPYEKELKLKARQLRKESTLSEVLLWKKLKGKSLGYQFNRQKPLLYYIVDFFCPQLKLVIEVDGISHDSPKAQQYDAKRQKAIEAYGVVFLRIDDIEVKRNIDAVVWAIEAKIKELEEAYGLGADKI
ncbi:MAG: endonuclease domain-containing protein [Aureispira sp.]|nr:endonuclease domain-containing protein [Aureispira sp.]